MGCGQPAGEAGYNIARVVAILAGLDDVPGVTVNRYCSSSLQTIRMAAHAIKAGEGDMLHRRRRRDREPLRRRRGRHRPANPIFAGARPRTADARRRRPADRGPRPRACPTSTSPWARRPRTWPSSRTSAAQEMDEFAALSPAAGRGHRIENGFFEREITPVTLPDGTVVTHGRRPPARHDRREAGRAQAGVPPRRRDHRRQRLPAERRRRRGDRHERHQGQGARHHARWPASSPAASPASTRRSWASARSRPAARRWPGPA